MNDSLTIKVLYIDNTFTFGGAINSLEYLLKALDKDKFLPILITGQPEKFLSNHFDDFIYYKVNFKLPWVHNKTYKKITSLSVFKNINLLKIINKIRFIYWLIFITFPESLKYYKIGKRHNVKFVHLNNIFGSQLAGILAAKLLRVPCVAHLRGFEGIHPITKLYARMIDHHIAISSAIKNNLFDLQVPENKISIVYDAIDLDKFKTDTPFHYLLKEFNIKADEKIFGIFGRIIEWKGIKEFVLAANMVIKKIPQAKAFIVGDISDGSEEYFKQVKKLIKNLNLVNDIILTGYRHDVPALMSLMDIVVHASIRPEPFGMVLTEAMAMKKPVVATKAGGPLDIVIDGTTGLLVPISDSKKMAGAIIKILKDPQLAKSMGLNGRIRAEKVFSKERYARQVEEIYRNLTRFC